MRMWPRGSAGWRCVFPPPPLLLSLLTHSPTPPTAPTHTHTLGEGQSFYQGNGFLEYATLARLHIDDPQAFITKNFGGGGDEGLFVSGHFIAQTLVSQVDASLATCLEDGGWCDARLFLTLPLSAADMGIVLSRCPSFHEHLGPGKKG